MCQEYCSSINGGEIFYVVMMTLDGSRVITTLRAAVRNSGDGTWAMAGCCDSVPDGKSPSCVLYRKIQMRVTRMTMRAMCHFACGCVECWCLLVFWIDVFNCCASCIDKLDVKGIPGRFCIPNGVIVELLNDEEVPVPTEKLKKYHHLLKGTIQRGAPVPSAGVVQGIPPFHPDSTRLHSSQHRPGADGMQHHKHVVQPRPYAAGATILDEGGAKGHVAVRGAWAGHQGIREALLSKLLLVIPGPEKRGHIVDWVEKASFACLNKLFEIDAKERHYKTLLSARNLMAVVRESQEYIVNILPRKMPKEVVPGEHYTMKDLPIYQEFKEADAEKRRALLDDREREKRRNPSEGSRTETRRSSPPNKAPAKKRKLVKNGKGVKEPTPPKEFAPPPITHEAEVIIEEPVNPAPHSISSGPGHVAGLNHSVPPWQRLPVWLIWLRKLRPSNHPGSPNPDAMQLKPFGPPSKRPRSARNLRSGLIGRLQDRQQEIEVSCSSAYDAHPEGAK
ncbi:hypothetical protein CK203_046318 [Vitis vinifera]|uniref:Uncharacterized protein n=1 Tax=Vitis vinifera TaxID=29760 RepID=A0A438FW96_VITVI|nr:hypothetical protein CK203_046318 [Vitis vinifera]